MISFGTLLLFAAAVIGLTHIIVDPATIAQGMRKSIEKRAKTGNKFWGIVNKVVSCYQCCGVWVGWFCGGFLFYPHVFVIIFCGAAGSFIATWGATYLNYLEARSIISMEESNDET